MDDLREMHLEELHELEELIRLRNKYTNNPVITYLNINSLRNKIYDLREIMQKALPDIPVMAETKLNNDFPTQNFIVEKLPNSVTKRQK